jgi:hypothetical protein
MLAVTGALINGVQTGTAMAVCRLVVASVRRHVPGRT